MRLRFAPSPTGQLHVGNARTALFNYLFARHAAGEFILRIEDTDADRSSAESEAAILEDLRWLGLDWDEGPDVGGPCGPYRQSDRLHLYQSYANELLAAGRAYRCFCQPSRLEAERRAALSAGRSPRYAGTCRRIAAEEAAARVSAGEPGSVRFKVPESGHVAFEDLVRGGVAFDLASIGDPVILRSDGRPAYNFAVVVDDALMGVTHVIRGEDHISNTPRQLLFYQALGFTPPKFAHLSLVLGPDHGPLSKRHGATSVAEFRGRGYLPEALINYLALVGWSAGGDELLTIDQLVQRFSLAEAGHSAGVFDEQKLAWVNRHYLRCADPERLAALAVPYLARSGLVTSPSVAGLEYLASVLPMATASVDRLDEVPARLRFLFVFDPGRMLADDQVRAVLDAPGARAVVVDFAREIAAMPRLDRERFRQAATRVRERTGFKGRALFHPIRVAVTGQASGPELDVAVPAIDAGAELPAEHGIRPIQGCRERAAALAAAL